MKPAEGVVGTENSEREIVKENQCTLMTFILNFGFSPDLTVNQKYDSSALHHIPRDIT